MTMSRAQTKECEQYLFEVIDQVVLEECIEFNWALRTQNIKIFPVENVPPLDNPRPSSVKYGL